MNPHLAMLLSPIYSGALAPAHRADLAKSGLTADTMAAQKIRSVPPHMIGRLLGFDIEAITSAMLLPYLDPRGGFLDHVRLKIFPPLPREDGTVKYLQRKGSLPHLYFLRACLDRVLAGEEPLWLIEGEKKAAAIAQLGLPAVGFAGVHGWHVKGSRTLIDDFTCIPLQGRPVEVVPDGDFTTNPQVRRAIEGLGWALAQVGSRARAVVLPTAMPA